MDIGHGSRIRDLVSLVGMVVTSVTVMTQHIQDQQDCSKENELNCPRDGGNVTKLLNLCCLRTVGLLISRPLRSTLLLQRGFEVIKDLDWLANLLPRNIRNLGVKSWWGRNVLVSWCLFWLDSRISQGVCVTWLQGTLSFLKEEAPSFCSWTHVSVTWSHSKPKQEVQATGNLVRGGKWKAP